MGVQSGSGSASFLPGELVVFNLANHSSQRVTVSGWQMSRRPTEEFGSEEKECQLRWNRSKSTSFLPLRLAIAFENLHSPKEICSSSLLSSKIPSTDELTCPFSRSLWDCNELSVCRKASSSLVFEFVTLFCVWLLVGLFFKNLITDFR